MSTSIDRFSLAIVSLSLVGHLGCVIDQKIADPADDEGTGDSTTGQSATDDSATGQDNSGTTVTGATTANTTAHGDSADDGGSGSSSDSGSDSSDTSSASLCEQFCMGGCLFGDPPIVCIAHCEEQFTEFGARSECDDTYEAYLICMVESGCQEASCEQESIQLEMECSCDVSGGGDVGGTTCEWAWSCYGRPGRAVVCEGETCTCFEEGAITGTCEANGVCAEAPEAFGAFALDCCGFDDFPEFDR